MTNENKEMLNDSILIKATKDSYMKKEDLIKIIENITCITGYKINVNSDGNKYVTTLSFEVDIN